MRCQGRRRRILLAAPTPLHLSPSQHPLRYHEQNQHTSIKKQQVGQVRSLPVQVYVCATGVGEPSKTNELLLPRKAVGVAKVVNTFSLHRLPIAHSRQVSKNSLDTCCSRTTDSIGDNLSLQHTTDVFFIGRAEIKNT